MLQSRGPQVPPCGAHPTTLRLFGVEIRIQRPAATPHAGGAPLPSAAVVANVAVSVDVADASSRPAPPAPEPPLLSARTPAPTPAAASGVPPSSTSSSASIPPSSTAVPSVHQARAPAPPRANATHQARAPSGTPTPTRAPTYTSAAPIAPSVAAALSATSGACTSNSACGPSVSVPARTTVLTMEVACKSTCDASPRSPLALPPPRRSFSVPATSASQNRNADASTSAVAVRPQREYAGDTPASSNQSRAAPRAQCAPSAAHAIHRARGKGHSTRDHDTFDRTQRSARADCSPPDHRSRASRRQHGTFRGFVVCCSCDDFWIYCSLCAFRVYCDYCFVHKAKARVARLLDDFTTCDTYDAKRDRGGVFITRLLLLHLHCKERHPDRCAARGAAHGGRRRSDVADVQEYGKRPAAKRPRS